MYCKKGKAKDGAISWKSEQRIYTELHVFFHGTVYDAPESTYGSA